MVNECCSGLTKPMQLPALAFPKEGHWIVKLASFINGSATLSWQVITPQLMGRAVRQRLTFRCRWS